ALLTAARARRIPDAVLLQAGLTVGNQDKFVNRLMFPIVDATGRIIGFGGRTLGDAPAKYVNSATTPLFDKSHCLYGLNHARHEIVRSGVAVLVEGYTDCIMSHSKGITNAVATLGTSFTSGHGRILRRYAKKVILVFDGDTAGVAAANRALEVALAQRIDVGIAIIPAGQDPCDYLLAEGADAFRQLINSATDVFDFKWSRLEQAFAKDETLAGRKAAIDEFLQAVATALGAGNLNAIETGLLVNRLARVLSMDAAVVAGELRTRTGRVQRANVRTVANAAVSALPLPATLAARAQSEIIEVLLCDPSLFSTVAKRLTLDDFDVPELASIARIVFEICESGSAATVDAVLRRIEQEEIAAYVVDLEHAGQAKGNFGRRLDDALDILAECGARRRAGAGTGAGQPVAAQREKRNRYTMGMT
ncbi:MAG TPA: toprim domain-containing protein, partial [Phycisphaerales bacterium]|nr:toprim domain-containing protein [Phycisphaerales bacterium]